MRNCKFDRNKWIFFCSITLTHAIRRIPLKLLLKLFKNRLPFFSTNIHSGIFCGLLSHSFWIYLKIILTLITSVIIEAILMQILHQLILIYTIKSMLDWAVANRWVSKAGDIFLHHRSERQSIFHSFSFEIIFWHISRIKFYKRLKKFPIKFLRQLKINFFFRFSSIKFKNHKRFQAKVVNNYSGYTCC